MVRMMGTRHNIAVKIDGKTVLSQYGQWDGYLTGQGKDIAEFLSNEMDFDKFSAALRALKPMTDDEIDAFSEKVSSGEVSDWDEFYDLYPWLSRNAGSKILSYIQNGVKDHKFNDDMKWCEYLYVIDMDSKTVSVNDCEPIAFSEWTVEKMKEMEEAESE